MKTCPINSGLIFSRNLQAFLTALALFLLAISPGKATTWWVETATTGSQAGTQQNPFKTIAQGMTAAQSGDTVEVEYGTYYEMVTAKSGVNLLGYPGQHVTVSAFDNLSPTAGTTWNPYMGTTVAPAGDVYTTAAVPLKVRDLYGRYTVKQPISRYPAANSPWAAVSMYNSSTHIITLSAPLGITLSSPYLSAFVYIFITKQEGYLPYYITNISTDRTQITINVSPTDTIAQQMALGDHLIVCNHPQLIKNPGDWAYQDNGNGTTALYWYPAGGQPGLIYGETNNLTYAIKANGVSGLTISGLEVMGAVSDGILVLNSSHVTVQNCSVHDNGFGYSYSGVGILSRSSTYTTIANCEIYGNYGGVGSLDDTNFVLQQSDVGYDGNDGVDLGIDVSNNVSPTVQNCYIHNHTAVAHPDSIQFQAFSTATGFTTNPTISNNFLDISGQGIMSERVNGVTATNNVVMDIEARGITVDWGTSTNFALNNNTYALTYYTATSASEPGTTVQYNIKDSVFYAAELWYSEENSSNYNLFWNATLPIAFYNNIWYTGTTQSMHALTLASGYEASSTPGNPAFTNAPTYFGVINSALWSSLSNKVTIDAPADGSMTGFFNVNDVVEMEGDGVARQVLTSTNTGTQVTITFTPPLTNLPIRELEVRDWPAGTTNLVVDTTPKSGSPALTGSDIGGQRGSTIKTAQYAAGSFDGTGTRNIPVIPADTYYGAYNLYPYNGIVP